MLNELKHPEGGAVTGVLSITKTDGKTGEVTEYPMQYNHLTRWGLRLYNMGYTETPVRQGLVRVHSMGLLGLNRPIPPEDEVAAFSISKDKHIRLPSVGFWHRSNENIAPERHGHVYNYTYTHNSITAIELSVFSLGWYTTSSSRWVPFNVITVRDAQARPSSITLNKGDKLNFTYRLIIKQDPTQQNALQFQYKGKQHTVRIVTEPHTVGTTTYLYTPNRLAVAASWFTYSETAVAVTPKHDSLASSEVPYIPDNAEWRKKRILRFHADTFISDNVQKFVHYNDGYLYTLTFDPPLSKGRGDVWEFSWITELHDRKTS